MPTYEFRAPDGSVIERIYKISEVPDAVTLEDGSVATRIISGGAGLLFKGSGFYITDYGTDGKKDQRPASSSETKSDTKSESKSDAKPAAPSAPSAPKAD
ncbi:MAG: FmdB family zinc ribbon protein [Gemmatimonas sp.]